MYSTASSDCSAQIGGNYINSVLYSKFGGKTEILTGVFMELWTGVLTVVLTGILTPKC